MGALKMAVRRLFLAFSAVGAVALAVVAGPRAEPPRLEAKLTLAAKPSEFGEPVTYAVRLINRGKAPVTLVAPNDGSAWGWRTPLVGWSVLPAADRRARHPAPVPLRKDPRCGNMNPLTKDEVFTLAPGESREFRAWITAPQGVAKPGRYRVVFYYRNDPARDGTRGLDPTDAETLARLRASTPVFVKSNEVVLTVPGDPVKAARR